MARSSWIAPLLRLALAIAALLATPGVRAQDAPIAVASFNTQICYVGDTAVLEIAVENADEVVPPDLSTIPGARFQFSGTSNESSSFVTIVNGRRTQQTTRRLVMRWIVTPEREGTVEVPPVTVGIGGGLNVQTPPTRLRVLLPERAPDDLIVVTPESTSLYVNQSSRVRVTWFIVGDVEDYAFRASEIDPALDVQPIAAPRQGRDRVYEVDIFGVTTQARLGYGTRGGERVRTFEFDLVITPREPGLHTLGPIAVSFEERLGLRATRRLLAQADPIEISVAELPIAGRPPGFNGLLGTHAVSASVDTDTVNVGDPITLTVTITGAEPMVGVTDGPDLAAIPGFTDDFRLSGQGWAFVPGSRPGERTFSTIVRAARDTVREIPPIPLAFFDPGEGEYRVARSDPIPLAVRAVREVTAADAVVGSGPSPISREALTATPAGLWAIDRGPAVLARANAQTLNTAPSPVVLAALAVPPAAFAALAGMTAWRRRRVDEAERRRRGALNAARRVLRTKGPAEAVRLYLAHAFDARPEAVTGADSARLLAGTDAAQPLAELIAIHEAERYAAGRAVADPPPDPARVLELLRAVDRSIREDA